MLQTIKPWIQLKLLLVIRLLPGRFEQIATVQKTDWLPLYYAAYSSIIVKLAITDNAKKDEALTPC